MAIAFESEPNDIYSLAQIVSLSTFVYADLSTTMDEDWFEFHISTTGTVSIDIDLTILDDWNLNPLVINVFSSLNPWTPLDGFVASTDAFETFSYVFAPGDYYLQFECDDPYAFDLDFGDYVFNLLSVAASQITGTVGNDSLYGGANDNLIIGDLGNDLIYGGAGNDTINGGAGNDSMEGDSGADSLVGGTGNDLYFITDTLDTIVELPSEGSDLVYSFVTITMGANIETANLGGSASTNCTGNELANFIACNEGNNSVSALDGSDSILGGLGNDWLHGNIGEDLVIGESGDDTVMGGKGNDSVFGENDNDLVRGGENNDSLFGGDGNDTLLSGKGEDLLSGGAGDDSLDARLGNDTMTGGVGNDIFLLASTLNGTTNVDTITDFTPGTDEIWLHPGIFTALAPQYGSHVSLSANLLYDSGTGVLSYDADGAGGGAAVAFANVGPGVSFTGTDFFVGA